MSQLSFRSSINKIFVLSLGLFILAGCSTARDPKTLTPYTSSEYLIVKEDFTYSGKRGLYNFKEGLREGAYKAELQDEAGTYYRGPGKCTFTMPESYSKTFESQGGLWVPRDGGVAKAQIYSYYSAEDFYADNPEVRSALIHIDDGKIFIWDKVLSEDSLKNLEWRKSNEGLMQ